MLENIYHTIRGRTKSPRTLESNSKGPLSAAKPFMKDLLKRHLFWHYQDKIHKCWPASAQWGSRTSCLRHLRPPRVKWPFATLKPSFKSACDLRQHSHQRLAPLMGVVSFRNCWTTVLKVRCDQRSQSQCCPLESQGLGQKAWTK